MVDDAIDARDIRVKTRVVKPAEQMEELFLTRDYDADLKEYNEFYKNLMKNPFDIYLNFRNRLEKDGGSASFPEYKGTVSYLCKKIFQTEEILTFLKSNRPILYQQLIIKLISIQIKTKHMYPYRATIKCIESLLEALDIYYRTKDSYDHYYHTFRYHAYINLLLDDKSSFPHNIVFPCHKPIGSTNLIKLRCVPILLLGVVDQPIKADQYVNTPLDFWSHDVQHARRQIQETLRYFDVYYKHIDYYDYRDLFGINVLDNFYYKMYRFTFDTILPLINKKDVSEEAEMAMRDLIKLIVFEIVHEKAWPITPKSICRNLTLRYDTFPIDNLEIDKDKNITTRIIKFDDPTVLSNVRGKLRAGFYDDTVTTNDKIVDTKYRKSGMIALAAQRLLDVLNCKNKASLDYLLALTTDKTATQEYLDVPEIEIRDYPKDEVPYPEDESYDDYELFEKYKLPDNYGENKDRLAKVPEDRKWFNKYLKYKSKYLSLKKL